MWNRDELKGKARWTVSGFLALTLLLGISASVNGCSAAGSPPQAQISNAALEEKIKTNFNTDAQLKAANLEVMANAERNEVTLSGTVESESLKIKAVDSARTAQAGINVTSKIEVDQNCCGSGAMHGPREGMPGMKGMPGREGRRQ